MELDKRIKAITDIKSVTDGCHDWKFMTKKGYFANSIFDFKDLKRTCMYGEYTEYREHDQCFLCEIDHYDGTFDHTYYRYFIPEDSLLPEEEPEKKYRPFKDHTEYKEYLNDGIIESWIQIREKLTGEVSELMYVGGSGAIICLGAYSFDLNELFYDFELFNESTGEWQPFGVLDE